MSLKINVIFWVNFLKYKKEWKLVAILNIIVHIKLDDWIDSLYCGNIRLKLTKT